MAKYKTNWQLWPRCIDCGEASKNYHSMRGWTPKPEVCSECGSLQVNPEPMRMTLERHWYEVFSPAPYHVIGIEWRNELGGG